MSDRRGDSLLVPTEIFVEPVVIGSSVNVSPSVTSVVGSDALGRVIVSLPITTTPELETSV